MLAKENFSGLPALGYFCGDVFTLGSLHQVDLVERDALAFGETDGSASGGTPGVVGNGLGRAGDFVLDVGLLGDKAADPGGEAAGATEGFDGDALLVIFGGEVAFEDGLQFGDGAGQHAGGNFFGANLEEELDAAVWLRSGLGHGSGAFSSLLGGGHWDTTVG